MGTIMSKFLYAGSFNPYTIGHHSVFSTAVELFGNDQVLIGIAQNGAKADQNPHILKWRMNPAFPYFESSAIKVVDEPMVADYANNIGCKALVRSMRNSIDLVTEVDLATWNKEVGEINTVFVPSGRGMDHISSSAIRSIDALGKDMSEYFVNQIQYERWKTKKPKRVIVVGRMGAGKSSFIKDHFHDEAVTDMDVVVKNALSEESSTTFKEFFKSTEIPNVSSHWLRIHMMKAKEEVETIINDELCWGGSTGIYEISAFTSYNLEQYYGDSIIVYVDNYNNGKQRDIDPNFMSKVKQLQTIPKVVDFVIDQRRGGIAKIISSIKNILETK